MTKCHKGDKRDNGNEANTGKSASSPKQRPRPADQRNESRSATRQPRNLVASVSARLLKVAHEREEEYQLVLMRYGLERPLYRLGRSPYAGQFVVKGALLFAVWTAQTMQAEVDTTSEASNEVSSRSETEPAFPPQHPHRATHDLDLLGFGSADLARLVNVFRDLCQLQFPADENDGLTFQPETVQAAPIREDQEYGGIRAHVLALLGKARMPLQVDVGFGDVVTPAPAEIDFPTLLPDLPAPRVRVYPRETVVAEKFEAIVRLGLPNTRMKDFYDLWTLANQSCSRATSSAPRYAPRLRAAVRRCRRQTKSRSRSRHASVTTARSGRNGLRSCARGDWRRIPSPSCQASWRSCACSYSRRAQPSPLGKPSSRRGRLAGHGIVQIEVGQQLDPERPMPSARYPQFHVPRI
jgi:hypothetical protein